MNVLRDLWPRLTTPRSTDEDEARREYMTKAILVTMCALVLVATLTFTVAWSIGALEPDMPAMALAFSVILGGGLWLAHRGHWRLSGYLPQV